MTVSDWIALSVGIGTMLLAAATFWLGYHTRRSANASATSLDAIRAQADATRKQAEIAERALTAAQEQYRRQARAYVIWDAGDVGEPSVTDDPQYWPSGKTQGLAIRVEARVRNVGPVAAYVDRVEHSDRIRLAVVSQPYLPPGESTEVSLFIPVEDGAELEIGVELLGLRFRSLLSDEARIAEAMLGASGRANPVDEYGQRHFEGYAYVSALEERETG